MGFHLSDRDLLLSADRELPQRQDARVRRHLAECTACHSRMDALGRTLAEADGASADDSIAVPPAGAARARLRARLIELSQEPARGAVFLSPSWALAAAAALIASVGLTWLLANPVAAPVSASLTSDTTIQLPRVDLTPGAVRNVTVADVCGPDRDLRPEPVPAPVHQRVFESYGADVDRASEYELDYLITPELGGSQDARNLWPQPFTGTVWSAYVKDELELHLHEQVCAGRMDFATAQREIAHDWIAAYKRHFNTDRPRRDYARSPLTEHDGDLLRAELEELGIAAHPGQSGATLMALLVTAREPRPE
jgi:hypothetical protein